MISNNSNSSNTSVSIQSFKRTRDDESNNNCNYHNNNNNISLEFILNECSKLAKELKGTNDYLSPIVWRKIGSKFGLTKVDLPKLYGGYEFKVLEVVKIYENLGRLSLNMRDVIGGAHIRSLISRDPNNQSEYSKMVIKSVVNGEAYVGIVITEPSCGSDFESMKSYSIKDENGDFILNGEKCFNARLEQATHIILYVLDNKDGKSINVFLLPINHSGLEIVSFKAQGLLANSFGGVTFTGMHVSKDYLIGNQGDGELIFQNHFLYWRLVQAAAAIGTGKDALDQAASRMIVRNCFGGPIGRFTHLQQDLAQHTAKLEMSSFLVERIAKMFDDGASAKELSKYVPMAKAECIEFALSACDWSMSIHGAEGYSSNFTDLGQRVCDLQGLRIADGTTHIMRSQVVRQFYDDRFWDWSISNVDKRFITAGLPYYSLIAIKDKKISLGTSENFIKYVDDIQQSGGPCAVVTVVNSIQIICSMFKLQSIDIEKLVQDSYEHYPQLSKGRLANLQVLQLFNYLVSKYLVGIGFKASIDYNEYLLNQCMDKFNNNYNNQTDIQNEIFNSKKWNDLDSGILLTPQPYQIKIISYNVIYENQLLGRHFIVLIDHQNNNITVVDPNHPEIQTIFKLIRLNIDNNKLSSLGLEDLNGNKGFQLIINSIFTFDLFNNK